MARPFLVLVTGHPAAGKSTFAPRLADALSAVCLSKDQIRFRLFDGWRPHRPYDGASGTVTIGDTVFHEDEVVWSLFYWAVREAVQVAPVVAETAFIRPATRDARAQFISELAVPAAEVMLTAPADQLLQRYRARFDSPTSHNIYRTFQADNARNRLETPYLPLLPHHRVVEVDTTDIANLDTTNVASTILDVVL